MCQQLPRTQVSARSRRVRSGGRAGVTSPGRNTSQGAPTLKSLSTGRRRSHRVSGPCRLRHDAGEKVHQARGACRAMDFGHHRSPPTVRLRESWWRSRERCRGVDHAGDSVQRDMPPTPTCRGIIGSRDTRVRVRALRCQTRSWLKNQALGPSPLANSPARHLDPGSPCWRPWR